MECLLSYSVNGWDLVIQGLINMSFSIFDTLSPKNTNGIIEREGEREGRREGGEGEREGSGGVYVLVKLQGHTVMISTIDSCFPEDSTE